MADAVILRTPVLVKITLPVTELTLVPEPAVIEFTKTLGIRGVPTIKAYKSGDEVFSKSGVLQREELLNVGKMVM